MSNSIIGIHSNNNNNNINNNNSNDNDDYNKFNSNPSICMSKWNQFLPVVLLSESGEPYYFPGKFNKLPSLTVTSIDALILLFSSLSISRAPSRDENSNINSGY